MKTITGMLLAVVLVLVVPQFGFARIINVPEENQTIQAAINTAEAGDTVLVQPGIYGENILFNGIDIVVGSLLLTTGDHAYIDSTIIDGNASASVVRIRTGETDATVLTGFTIINGRANYGGGVYINAASPTLDHLIITRNHAIRDGGGIYCTHNANPIFKHLTVSADTAERSNGGLFTFDNSSATIINSIFRSNIPIGTPAGQTITFSNIQNGYAGQGNINSNPLFVDPGNGNFHLQENSPCIDAGDPNSPPDQDESRADIGAFYFDQTPYPRIVASHDSLDFGGVLPGAELARIITIINQGDADLIVQHPTTDGEPFHADPEDWESVTLEPLDTLEAEVFFAPTEIGDFVGHFIIESNDPDNETLDIILIGSGAVPIIAVASDSLDFGVVLIDNSSELPLVVSNNGGADLTISDASVQGDNYSIDFGGEFTVHPDESAEIIVTFSPSEAGGFDGEVTITSDDPENAEMTVALVGVGRERTITELGAIDTPGQALGVAIVGSLALLSDGQGGLRIIDYSDPANPAEISSIETPGNARDIVVVNGLAFIADEESGLRMIDFSDPEHPAEVWTFDTPGRAYGVAVVGSFAYVADYEGGLRIVDISDPESPHEVGASETNGNARAVAILGDYAYIAAEEGGLEIIDISDPESPHRIGSVETPGSAYGIIARGGYVYVADGDNGLCVIDVSTPANPSVITSYNTPGIASNVTSTGELIYVADSTTGIQVINIADLENIETVGTFNTHAEACDIAILGDYCFVADGESGLHVLDVSEIAQYPVVSVTPEALRFQRTVTGYSSDITLTIHNRGNCTLNIFAVAVEGNYFESEIANPVAIEPMESYDLAVTFTPEEAGDFAGTLTIISDDPYQPHKQISLSGSGLVFDLIEETGSLLEFFAGTEDGCAYDNWVSHISEGVARDGYNEYCPPELDRQTNGFGSFTIIDSLENPDEITASWYEIFSSLYHGDIETARVTLALSSFSDKYQIVRLEDGEKNYVILRENLNNEYFDDNGTQDAADDVRGSFDLGWGLFVFDLDPFTPDVIIEVPHPEDDFLAPPSGIDAFFTIGARALFVAGAGREVSWTGEGNYTNLKSFSDPTRIEGSAFNQAHKAGVDLIDQEFVIQIHSYDSESHPTLMPAELSTRLDYYPNRPVLDFENHFDIVSLTPEIPVPANSTGHENHDSLRVDDFYAVWYDIDVLGTYRYHNRLDISNDVVMFASSMNEQMLYSMAGHDTLRDDEKWLHVEQDEFPNVITEDILNYYSAGGAMTYHNFSPAVQFYRPVYTAVRNYYHHRTLHNVPDDYQTIQAAVDASVSGDTVLVQPGTYVETVNFKGKDITVGSLFLNTGDQAYIESTIIDGNRNGSVVRFDSGETNNALLTGFTIRNGSGSIDAENDISGGGIHCHNASPRLNYLKIVNNNAWYAAGIYCELGSDAIIDHCLITNNVAAIAGGGMDCYAASPTMSNCTIADNQAIRGGGLYLFDGCNLTITNSIFWNNAPQELLYSLSGVPDTVIFQYTDIMGGERRVNTHRNGAVIWGEGNIDQDPRFVAPEEGDYSLSEGSPCQDAGNPGDTRDPDDTWIDMGALYSPYERDNQPRMVVNSNRFGFGTVEVGQNLHLILQIHNTGYAALTVSEMRLSGDHPDDFSADFGQELTVDPGQIRNVTLTFAPGDAGRREANMVATSNDPVQAETQMALGGFGLIRGDRHLWIVPDDLERIQEAIDISVDGDTILVRSGVYQENIDFSGKALVVGSFFLTDRDPELITNTVIRGDNSGGVVSFISGEDTNSVLSGFTITGGQDGVYSASSNPTISYCVINSNAAVNTGGAGLYCRGGASPSLLNCTLVDNSARWGGGMYIREGSGVTLTNCIVWANDPNTVYSSGNGVRNRLSVDHSNIEGDRQGVVTNNNCQVTWGEGNINTDPLFVDLGNGDFRLGANSPCVDAGNANSPLDADSTRADLGALYYDHRTPRIAVEPAELDFELTRIGELSEKEIVIFNRGVADLTVTNLPIEGEYFSCDFRQELVIHPDDSTVVTVAFIPEVQGDFEAVLTILSDDPNNWAIPVRLHGVSGSQPPEIISEIGDLSYPEDSGPWTIADLDTVFNDPEGDNLTFSAIAPDPLTVLIGNEDHVLVLEAPANFNTEGLEIQVTASDSIGGRRVMIIRTLRGTANQMVRLTDLGSVQPKDVGSTNEGINSSSTPFKIHQISRDGSAEDIFTLVIEPINDEPVWVNYPQEIIRVESGGVIEFVVVTEDVDGDRLNLRMIGNDLPDEVQFVVTENGRGRLNWQTTIETVGHFEVVLSVSDGAVSSEITVNVIVIHPPQHFTEFDQTEQSHNLHVTGVSINGDPVSAGWEVGVFTPAGVLAGGDAWTEVEMDLPVWGADDNHQDYFHEGETMSLKLWDYQADAEWDGGAVVEEGEMNWVNNGNTVLTVESNSLKTLEVAMRLGWKLISVNVIPSDQDFWAGDPGPEIVPMMSQLRRPNNGAHHLILMKDERGRFYIPERGFGNMSYWNLAESYQVRIDSAMSAFWTGTPINPQADVPITRGWNYIAYFPDYQLSAYSRDGCYVLSPIIDHVLLAKDGLGNFMIPSRGFFSNMPPWREGQGYQINVDQDVVLNYPQAQNQAAALSVDPESVKGRWADVPSTGANMSVLVTKVSGVDLSTSDQVAAFSPSGLMVGVGRVIDGQIGIAVWGDDASTQAVDGLKDGEAFTLKLWNAAEDVVVDLSSRVIEGDRLVYLTDGFTVIDASVTTALPTEFYLSQNYPNPFNAVTRVAFGLPEASRVTVRVFDLSGREVSTLVSGELQAGHHSVVLDGESMVSGVYIVKMEATNFSAVRKVMLVK